ncbi:MAG TPA: response regulator [Candidatus Bathyarchaeia archaeon]|jgi:two-component system response regulator RegA|nr:response regulator [Candidatus Bathyarchaeia archaeon]
MTAILVVDDDEVFRSRVLRALGARGFTALGAADHAAALEVARSGAADRALVDLRLPGRSGLEVVRDLRRLRPQMSIVVLTGYSSIPTAIESLRLGAMNYLSKPVDVDQMLAAFDHAPANAQASPTPDVPSLARMEWEYIQRVLAECGGNVSQAARVLGLHRRSLQRKLTKYPPAR